MELTNQQLMASHHKNGPCLVLAVPGAGKTTVLLKRIEYLISNGVKAKNILSITFSKAQAVDMQSRFMKATGDNLPKFSTIHSFAYDIIRASDRENRIAHRLIEDSGDYNKYSLVRRLYYKINNAFIGEDILDEFFSNYGFIKNSLVSPELFLKNNKTNVKNFITIYKNYEAFKTEHGFIDFDDMLCLAYEILLKEENILKRIRNAYKYIQVDEAQDTSKIQMEIIKLCALPDNNLFLVADDDQSIYGFRGANPQELLNFKTIYPDGKLYFMEENHRSYKDIVELSGRFIKHNKKRYTKNITTKETKTTPIALASCKYLKTEYKFITDNIEKILKEKPNETIAILYRNNISALALMDYLDRNNINYYIRDAKKSYLSHFVIKDILDILKLAHDPSNKELYEAVYYKLNAYLKKDYLKYISYMDPRKTIFETLLDIKELKNYQIDRITLLKYDFNKLKDMEISKAISYIEDIIGYRVYLDERIKKTGADGQSAELLLESLKLIAEGLKYPYELEEKLMNLKGKKIPTTDKKITLTTVHGAKGLEYDNVFIIDLVEGEFPSKKADRFDEDALEEERRLFYVALTRAKKKLFLIALKMRNKKPVKMSSFFLDIRNTNKK